MKSNFKVDPAITFDHMHTDEKGNDMTQHKFSSQVMLLFVMELITISALLGFMILMMN